MQTKTFWRRAVVLSCLVHGVLFALFCAGAAWFTAPQEPPLLELELVSAEEVPAGPAAVPVALPAASPEPVPLAGDPTAASPGFPAPAAQNPRLAPGAAAGPPPGPAGNAGQAVSEPAAGSMPPAAAGAAPAGEARPPRYASPRLIHREEPDYPDQARQEGWEGIVRLQLEVSEAGVPVGVTVIRSSGHGQLDDAAAAAAARWRFAPARDEASGMAVPCFTTVSIAFRLH